MIAVVCLWLSYIPQLQSSELLLLVFYAECHQNVSAQSFAALLSWPWFLSPQVFGSPAKEGLSPSLWHTRQLYKVTSQLQTFTTLFH